MKALYLPAAALLALVAPRLRAGRARRHAARRRAARAGGRGRPWRDHRHRAEAQRTAAGRAGRGLGRLGRCARGAGRGQPRRRAVSRARRSTSANRARRSTSRCSCAASAPSTFSIAGEPSVSTVVDGVVYRARGRGVRRSRRHRADRSAARAAGHAVRQERQRRRDQHRHQAARRRDFGGYVEARLSSTNGNEYRVRGALDLPLGESVRARVTGFYGNYDGNIRNIAVQQPGQRLRALWRARLLIEADPTPDLQPHADRRLSRERRRLLRRGHRHRRRRNAVDRRSRRRAADPARRQDRATIAQNLVTATKEKSYGVSLQADLDVGDHTADLHHRLPRVRQYRNPRRRLPAEGLCRLQPAARFRAADRRTPSPRNCALTSPGEQFFDYVVGAYYSRAETRAHLHAQRRGLHRHAGARPC